MTALLRKKIIIIHKWEKNACTLQFLKKNTKMIYFIWLSTVVPNRRP
jgi:hypothetical protein